MPDLSKPTLVDQSEVVILGEYQPRFFYPCEFLPRGICDLRKLDPRLLKIADHIREEYGPMICNTWWNKRLEERWGFHQWRGWRPRDCKVGAAKSQHKEGKALDLFPTAGKKLIAEIREDIRKGKFEWMEPIKGLEMEVEWLHFDLRERESLLVFWP